MKRQEFGFLSFLLASVSMPDGRVFMVEKKVKIIAKTG
jgi:hypothetical protein